jgi:dienelactone hydrolase
VSAGGWGSVAAAIEPLDGLVGIVNFAGGRGSRSPDNVCNEGRLVKAMGEFGEASRVPALFIYSENDHFFGPALAQRLHAAYVRGGGKAEFVVAPPSGDDGHGYFIREVGDWSPRVTEFLRRIGAVH